jgi:hypothetical protein
MQTEKLSRCLEAPRHHRVCVCVVSSSSLLWRVRGFPSSLIRSSLSRRKMFAMWHHKHKPYASCLIVEEKAVDLCCRCTNIRILDCAETASG